MGLGSVLNLLKPTPIASQAAPATVSELKYLLERYEGIDRVPRWIQKDEQGRKSPGIVARSACQDSKSISPSKLLSGSWTG